MFDGDNACWYAAEWNDATRPFVPELASTQRPLLVIIGGAFKHERSPLLSVKQSARLRLAAAGEIEVLDYRSAAGSSPPDRYSYTDNRGKASVLPGLDTVVLCDLNVLVDMYRALRADSEPRHFADVRETVAWLRSADFRPGFALGEAAAVGSADSDDLAASVDAWFDTPPGELTWEKLRGAYEAAKQKRRDFSDLAALAKNAVDANYLSLLKLEEVWRPLRGKPLIPRERMDAYASWLEYFNRPKLGAVGFPHVVAQSLLLGDAERCANASRLLSSPKKDTLATLRASAWDLLYPYILNAVSADSVDDVDQRQVVLMSADRPLNFFRGIVSSPLAVRTDVGAVHYLVSEAVVSKKFSEKQLRQIGEIQEALWDGAKQRIADWAGGLRAPDPPYVQACIADLERKLVQTAG